MAGFLIGVLIIKYSTNKRASSSVGIKAKIPCTIETSTKNYSLLYKSLYSDPIKAIIREISVNAVDSHKESGSTRKFDVVLPGPEYQWFSVRDYGTGMSREKIDGLYSRIGGTDKDKSNKCTGFWGIGSKSPLAYTNQFNIDSYVDGIHLAYTLAINDEGIPELNFFDECETDEPNGLKVSFMVKAGDYWTFRSRALDLFKWFEIKPNLTLDGKRIEIEVVKDHKRLPKSTDVWISEGSTPTLIMGSIAYPIDDNNVDIPSYLNGIVIKAKIGDVDITGSRESLEYSSKTKSFLARRIKDYDAFVGQELQRGVDACSTNFAKCQWLDKNYIYGYTKLITAYCNPNFKASEYFESYDAYESGVKRRSKVDARGVTSTWVIIDDLNDPNLKHKKHLGRVRKFNWDNKGTVFLVYDKNMTKDDVIKQTPLDEISRVYSLSELPDPPKAPRKPRAANYVPRKRGIFKLLCNDGKDHDVDSTTGPHYYLKRFRGTDESIPGEHPDFFPAQYYRVHATYHERVDNNVNFVHVKEYVEAEVKKAFKIHSDNYAEYLALEDIDEKYIKFINGLSNTGYKPAKDIKVRIEKIQAFDSDLESSFSGLGLIPKKVKSCVLPDILTILKKFGIIFKDSEISHLMAWAHHLSDTVLSIAKYLETLEC